MSKKYPEWFEIPISKWYDSPTTKMSARDSQRQKLYDAEYNINIKLKIQKRNPSFNSIEEIGDGSKLDEDYENKVRAVLKKRKGLVFENQIVISENLYAELLGVEKKVIPAKIKKQLLFEYGKEAVE